MNTDKLDKLFDTYKNYNKNVDFDLRFIGQLVDETINEYTPEEIVKYLLLNNLQKYLRLYIYRDVRFKDKDSIKSIIQIVITLYEENIIGRAESLEFIEKLLKNTAIDLDDDTMKLLESKYHKKAMCLLFPYFSEENQTDEYFEFFVEDRVGYIWIKSGIEDIVKGTKNLSEERIKYLLSIIKGKKEKGDNIYYSPKEAAVYLWNNIKIKNPEILNIILTYLKNDNSYIKELIKGTPPKNRKCVKMIFEKYFGEKLDSSGIENRLKKFYDLINLNQDIYQTIDIDFLDDKFDFFTIEQRVRIGSSNYDETMKSLNRLINNTYKRKILERIAKQDEGIEEKITILSKAENNYFGENKIELISTDSTVNPYFDKPEFVNHLTEIMLRDPENIFSIRKIDDIEKYDEIRKSACLRILNNEFENLGEKFNEMSVEDRKKFALFELLYGIDFKQAENIVKKYGKDIRRIEAKNIKETSIKKYIEDLEFIMNLNEEMINKMLQNDEFINRIKNANTPQVVSINVLNKDIVKMFERSFNEFISNSLEPKLERIKFKDEELIVETYSPIDENGNFTYTEFSLFIRQEGAYTEWETPENYVDYFNMPSLLQHGNCESFVNQSEIGIAIRSGRPKSGYLHTGNLMLLAPWDIGSSFETQKLSPINAMWNHSGRGIEFRIPQELINNTRWPHNESASDRIEKINKQGVKKRLPERSVYIKEKYNEELDKQNGEKIIEWNEAKRMAYNMNIPILVIDREGFAIQEEMVIQRDLELLGGEKIASLSGIEDIERLTGKKCKQVDWSKKQELTRKELIKEIIIRFENNATGIKHADIKNEYFTNKKRNDVIEALIKTIKNGKKHNLEQYYEDLLTIEEAIKEEKSKEVTNTGSRVYTIPKAYIELEKEIDSILVKDGKRKSFTQISNISQLDEVIKYIYDSKLYDDNKIHSTDHIIKTTIFAYILAERENLSKREIMLLLIASALHDSGSNGKDGNTNHAVHSAELASRILHEKNSPFKYLQLSETEINMIVATIEYHESIEFTNGKLQTEKPEDWWKYGQVTFGINDLIKEYQIGKKDIQTLKRLCELLKDADALDKARFSNIDSSTNISKLHTNSAKDIRMLMFADRFNNAVANYLLKKYYNTKQNSINAVELLKQKRTRNIPKEKQVLNKNEIYKLLSEFGIYVVKENNDESIGEYRE